MNQKETESGMIPPDLPDLPAQAPAPVYAQPINVMSVSTTAKDIESAVQNAEKFVDLQDKIRRMAVRVTNIHDWIDEAGNPYLQEQGAQKIAMCFGVSISNVRSEVEKTQDDKGDMITYYYHGEATWQGRISPQLGTCSSRDKFFGIRDGKPLPLSEVKLVDVRKKAYTNMLNRAIKSCLGLSYTWEEIAEASGGKISRDKLASSGRAVSYGKGTRGGNTAPQETQEQKDKRATLWDMLVELYGTKKAAADALQKATTWTDKEGKEVKGKREIDKVSAKQIEFLYPKVEKSYKDLQARQAKGADFRGEEEPNGN
jgi:hypothetical protein